MGDALSVDLPVWARAESGLGFTGRTLATRESRSWVVTSPRGPAVLRRLDPALFPPAAQEVRADLTWLHGFLDRFSETGFPAPRPVPALEGRSWTVRDGAVWELVSFLPGHAIGWSRRPGIAEVGRLLADYHDAVTRTPCPPQRSGAYPVDQLSGRTVPKEARRELDVLRDALAELGELPSERHVVHGDFTAHNVLATGAPATPSGVIDFALAYVEELWADLGFAIWRSGRSRQEAIGLDLERTGELVLGYAGRRGLPPSAAEAVPLYVLARGLQQVVKGYGRGWPPSDPLLARIRWLATNRSAVTESVAAAIDAAGARS